MNDEDIVKMLQSEADSLIVHDVIDKVKLQIATKKEETVANQNCQQIKSKNTFWFRFTTVAVAFVLLFTAFGLLWHSMSFDNTIYAKFSLDINPSLEISVNRDYKVIDVLCMNDDAQDIVNTEELKKKSVGAVIRAVIQNAIDQRYIREESDNAILISLSAVDERFCAKLKQIISDNIGSVTTNITVREIFEEYSHAMREEALEYGVTVAKLKMIKHAYSLNTSGMSENAFINFMKHRSIIFIQKYIEENSN